MKHALTVLALLFTAIIGYAQDPAFRTKQYNLDEGVAIQGYDPVAYFLQGKAVKGSRNLAVSHQGVLYYFASAGNKEAFKNSPSKYEPQYGGWCAYAMGAKGEKVTIDPKTFKITDGKLYLFYNRFLNNTLTDWNKNEAELRKNADGNWKKFGF